MDWKELAAVARLDVSPAEWQAAMEQAGLPVGEPGSPQAPGHPLQGKTAEGEMTFRPDRAAPGLPLQAVLELAPDRQDGWIRVWDVME